MNAIYPGSFDPFTNGHLSIVKRSLKLFDVVIVLIANNQKKDYMFNHANRIEIVRHALAHEIDNKDQGRLQVVGWSGVTADYINKMHIDVIVRGIRNDTDLYYEEDLETYHRDMTKAETIYLRPEWEDYKTSSSLARMYIQTDALKQLEKYVPRHSVDIIASKWKEEIH